MRRSRLVAAAAVLLAAAGVALAVRVADPPGEGPSGPPTQQPGPVLLVPGYGGATGGLEVLATAIRAAGREATVVRLPGNGTGDLEESADALEDAVDAARAAGAPSVDVIGYSAGGLVARLHARDNPDDVRRVVTLGSPHHGTELAALGVAFSPESCPEACRQMAPGSDLLEELNADDETPDGPQWLALWTTQDQVVTPPDSARLDGAVNLAVQDLCPGLALGHDQLPTAPVVQRLVVQALSGPELLQPGACPTT